MSACSKTQSNLKYLNYTDSIQQSTFIQFLYYIHPSLSSTISCSFCLAQKDTYPGSLAS